MKGDIHSFQMRHISMIYYMRMQRYQSRTRLFPIGLVYQCKLSCGVSFIGPFPAKHCRHNIWMAPCSKVERTAPKRVVAQEWERSRYREGESVETVKIAARAVVGQVLPEIEGRSVGRAVAQKSSPDFPPWRPIRPTKNLCPWGTCRRAKKVGEGDHLAETWE